MKKINLAVAVLLASLGTAWANDTINKVLNDSETLVAEVIVQATGVQQYMDAFNQRVMGLNIPQELRITWDTDYETVSTLLNEALPKLNHIASTIPQQREALSVQGQAVETTRRVTTMTRELVEAVALVGRVLDIVWGIAWDDFDRSADNDEVYPMLIEPALGGPI